jgi:hypothetical protein
MEESDFFHTPTLPMKAISRCVAQGCAIAMAMTIAHAESPKSSRSFADHDVVMGKELLVTAPEVVDSKKAVYPGPWSFGYLMEQAFTEEKAPETVAQWLTSWREGDQKAGIAPRPGLDELIRAWRYQDGHQAVDGDWKPKFENAPFRLLAIVNRMDLSLPLTGLRDERGNIESRVSNPSAPYYASSGSLFADATAGEGRFVFGVVDSDGDVKEGGTTLILEYGLNGDGSQAKVLNWAMDWHALGKHKTFDGNYLAALSGVTTRFTKRNPEPALKDEVQRFRRTNSPTQLLRIRSNDGSFGATREFREFIISSKGLVAGPLAGTPRAVFFEKGTRENRWLARWLRKEQTGDLKPSNARSDALGERLFNMNFPTTVKLGSEMIPVVAMVSPVPGNNADYHWDAHSMNASRVRRAFSLQTCCGCHCGDTRTQFFHIEPRGQGEAAKLSNYMQMSGEKVVVRDPGSKRQIKLQEMDERKLVFESFLNPGLSSVEVRRIREGRLERAH